MDRCSYNNIIIEKRSSKNIIKSNIFNNNTNSFSDGNIISVNADNTLITNNTFNNNKCKDINIKGKNNTIKNNIFNDEVLPTKITLKIKNSTITQYTTTIIKGTFRDIYGNFIPNAKLKLKINNKTTTIKTNKKGIYSYKFKATKSSINKITVSFKTNSKHNSTNIAKTFKVLKKGFITINKITNVQYNKKITIKGLFTTKSNVALKNKTLKLKYNDKVYKIKTDNKGKYICIIKANKVGQNNITISYSGNKDYAPTKINSSFNVHK